MEKQFLLFMFSKSLGGLKEGFEAEKGRRRRSRRRGCMGELVLLPCERSSIVPGTFSVASPRSLLSYPSPLPICKHIHIERDTHTHRLCPPPRFLCLFIHSFLSHALITLMSQLVLSHPLSYHSLSLFFSLGHFLYFSPVCFLSLFHSCFSLSPSLPFTLLCLCFPLLFSHPPSPLQPLIIPPHWCDCHPCQTVKAKTCNLLICIIPTSFALCLCSRPNSDCSKPDLVDCIHCIHFNFTRVFLLSVTTGCWGWRGVGGLLKLRKQGLMGSGIMVIGLSAQTCLLSMSWTAVIKVVSCKDKTLIHFNLYISVD